MATVVIHADVELFDLPIGTHTSVFAIPFGVFTSAVWNQTTTMSGAGSSPDVELLVAGSPVQTATYADLTPVNATGPQLAAINSAAGTNLSTILNFGGMGTLVKHYSLLTLTLTGTICTYAISPGSVSLDATAHAGQSFAVTTQSTCPWTATCPDGWITLTTATGTGSGNVVFNVAINAGAGRNSIITVAGQQFFVSQAGSSCSFSITPLSASFDVPGGSGSFMLSTQTGCAWTAVASDAWITITSATTGTGLATITYAVASNTGSATARNGKITVAGLVYSIFQAAGTGGGFAVTDPPEIVCVNGTTRPMMRDRIRRQMGVTPPIDNLPLGVAGEPPMGQPTPTNAEINNAITDAIRWINDKVGFNGSTAVNLSVPAYTGVGPQYISLTGVGTGSGTNQNNIDAIQKAVWNPGTGQALVPLFSTSQAEQDRLQTNWDNQPAAVPYLYLWERYQIGVLPGAQTTGTLQLYCTTAVYDFCDDTDILVSLPVDYELILEQYAVLLLSQRRPQEPGAMSRIQFLMPLTEQGITLIGNYFNDTTVQSQRSIGMTNLRRGYGTRRVRR